MIRIVLPLIAALVLAGCAHEALAPRQQLDGLPEGLAVALSVTPAEVGQHEAFSARLEVTNTTSRAIEVVTSHGCLATPNVLRNGKRVPFAGSWWGCTAAITTHTFAPGQTRSVVWEMRAELYAEHPGDVSGAPAPRGSYIVQAEFGTAPSAAGRRAVVEAPLRVR